MNEFLEIIQPYTDIILGMLIALCGWIWNTYKSRIIKIAVEAVAKTENDFAGVHNRSDAKLHHAIGIIAQKYPFVSEKTANKLITFALDNAKKYAGARVEKGLDAAEKYVNPSTGEVE